jgi:hypothetical protein
MKYISLYSLYLKAINGQEADIQGLKPVLYIFLCGFSLSSCPQHSLKVLLLLNPLCLLKYVLNCDTAFCILHFSIRIV